MRFPYRLALTMGLPSSTSDVGLDQIVQDSLENIGIKHVVSAVIAAVVCLVLYKALMALSGRALRKARLERPVERAVQMVLRIILLLIAVIVVMGCLEIPVTSLVAVLSVIGLALSLALQGFLSNVAGGFQIYASKPFKIGDWVEAGGCSGTVAEIGLFYTKLKNIENKLIQLPNSTIVSSTIINYTSEEKRRIDFHVSASYHSDPALVMETLARMVGEHPLTLPTPEPFIHVFKYKESDIEYVVRVWCATEDYWTIYFDLMDNLKSTFDRAGIEITYPHLNVHMLEK